MIDGIKYAIIRATYTCGKITEFGWVETLTSKKPVEWGDFDEGLFFDCEKEAILLAKKLTQSNFPTSVIALHFADTTEE